MRGKQLLSPRINNRLLSGDTKRYRYSGSSLKEEYK